MQNDTEKNLSVSTDPTLYEGAFWLLIATFVVKLIGLLYKVPLYNITGGFVMGIFSGVFEIQQLFLSFSTAGLPVALSKMISESNALGRYNESRKTFKIITITFVIIGFVGFFLMFFGSDILSVILNTPKASASFKALAPSMLFLSVTASLRGLFQGHSMMKPTSTTQIIESVVKVGLGISLAYMLVQWNFADKYISAGAVMGTTISTFAAMILMGVIFFRSSKNLKAYTMNNSSDAIVDKSSKTTAEILKYAVRIIIPISIGAVVVNLTSVLDLFLIQNRLISTGIAEELATAIYGAYKSCAQTLFNLPPSIITAINLSVIPAAAAAFIKKDHKSLNDVCYKAVKLVMILAIPCAVGLMVFSGQILTLLYPKFPEDTAMMTPVLRILGLASLFVSVASLLTAFLQAAGKMKLPVITMLIGGSVKLLTNYVLVGIPSVGIYGAPFGTLLCYVIMTLLNLVFIIKNTKIKIKLANPVLKPLFASAIMSILGLLSYFALHFVFSARISTVITLLICVIIYFTALILTGGIEPSDIERFPGGKLLARMINKFSKNKIK